MRIKKGFTLAEVLIVLMVIGVIATMTIPSLMKGVNEAQYKATYKKAYNTIVNIAEMEKASGQMPQKRNAAAATHFYSVLASALDVKYFVKQNELDGGTVLLTGSPDITHGFNLTQGTTNVQVGTTAATGAGIPPGDNQLSSWMVTEDGIAYAMILAGGDNENDCDSKAELITRKTAAEVAANACMVIVVDVNGLYRAPNRLERQSTIAGELSSPADSVSSSVKMTTLSRDRYYIYIGSDGATAGPVATTLSGRIVADLK